MSAASCEGVVLRDRTMFDSRWFRIAALTLVVLAGCRDVKDTPPANQEGERLDEDLTVYQVQSDDVPSGAEIVLRGVVVTAVDTFGDSSGSFWVQEPAGGPRSGVLVFDSRLKEVLNVGDLVDIENGVKKEHAHSTDKNGTVTEVIPAASGESLKITRQGAVGGSLKPQLIDVSELATPEKAEAWEGVLVQVANARLLDPVTCVQSSGNCEMAADKTWKKTRLTGPLEIQTSLAALPEAAGANSCLTNVTGIVDYFFTFKILPRSEGDIVIAESDTCLPAENSEEACGDNVDNDKNGQIDCADVACQASAARCAPSIVKIQNGEFPVGTKIQLRGVVVTARSADGKTVWIQDPKAEAGPQNGLALFSSTKLAAEVTIGTVLDVRGTLDEFDHKNDAGGETLTQLKSLTIENVQPGAGEVRIARPPSIAEARSEVWEGVLVEFEQVEVIELVENDAKKFVIGLDGVNLQVDDDIVKLETRPGVGAVLHIVGVMHFNSFAPHNKVTLIARDIQGAIPPTDPVPPAPPTDPNSPEPPTDPIPLPLP